MNQEREIFNQALDLASIEERVAFLKGACGTDAVLLERLLGLLRASDGMDGFLPEAPQAAGTIKLDIPNDRDEEMGQKLER